MLDKSKLRETMTRLESEKSMLGLFVITLVLSIWFIFIPIPYIPLLIANMLTPLVVVVLSIKRDNLYINGTKDSILGVALMPSLVLIMKSLPSNGTNYTMIFWIYVFILSIILSISMVRLIKGFQKILYKIGVVFIIAIYSIGLVQNVNCIPLSTHEYTYNVTVEDKRMYEGKSTNYYIRLEPFGKYTQSEEVLVTYKIYSLLNKNDKVRVLTYKSILGIDWFKLDTGTTIK